MTQVSDLVTKSIAAAADWLLIRDVTSNTDKKTPVSGVSTAIAANLPVASVSSNALTMPVSFSAYTLVAQGTGTAASTKINFEVENFDTGTNFAASTGVFTAPVAGRYKFNAQISVPILVATIGYISIFKNGTEFRRGGRVTTSTFTSFAITANDLVLAATDTIDVRIFVSNPYTVDNIALTNWFEGSLVSAA